MADAEESSLELLLDTISNTFGGVLFVAILIAILLQLAHGRLEQQPMNPSLQQDLIDLRDQSVQAQFRLRSLQRVRPAREALTAEFVPDEVRNKLATRDAAQVHKDAVASQHAGLLQDIAKTQQEINRRIDAEHSLHERLEGANKKANQLEAQLASTIAKNSETRHLPQNRSTTKSEVAVVLRYGRVYFLYRYGTALYERESNLDDFVLISEGSSDIRLTPKPYRGLRIEDSPGFESNLLQTLNRFGPSQIYVACGVWPDSFDSLAKFREALVRSGYHYRLIPMQDDEELAEGFVPDVQVQ